MAMLPTIRQILLTAQQLGYHADRWEAEQIQARYKLLGVVGSDSERLHAAITTFYKSIR